METSFSLTAVQDYLQQQQSTVGDQQQQQAQAQAQAEMATAAIPSIKVEEHLAPSTITPDLLSLTSPEPTTSSQSSSSKHPKKRKSWGQVLPEPKTALPPRKRAKTADEKEQRRIERVKRNRLAAHNSRERKREEMDKLQIINDGLVVQINAMKDQMAAMAAEISALRSGSSSASVPVTVNSFDFTTKQESYQPPQEQPSMVSPPMTATTSLQTPELGNLDSPDIETLDDFPATPMEDGFGGIEADLRDPTQQSAALLCDLQCRSQRSPSCPNSSSQPTPSQSLNSNVSLRQPASMAIFALNLQLFLSAISTLSSTSTITRRLQRHLPAHSQLPTSSTSPHLLLSMIYWMTALARLATSSTSSQPTKAHLQKVATGLAAQLRRQLHTLSSSPTRSPCEQAGGNDGGRVVGRDGRRRRGPKRSRARRRIVMTWDVKTAVSGVDRVYQHNHSPRLQVALQKLRERSIRRSGL